MNNVKLRRIALSFAAVCFGASMILLLLCNIAFPSLLHEQSQEIHRAFEQTVTLPCYVPGTKLWIKNLASYDGVLVEDGNNTEVFNTAALVIENKSRETVLFAQIEIQTENQLYKFEAMMLPPDSQTLIPDTNGQKEIKSEIMDCTGWSVTAPYEINKNLQIKSVDMNTIEVKNICSQTLTDISLYHKTYLSDSNIYIGGIAIETNIPILHPKESIQIKPIQYAEGYSKIVYIS